jgi:hypothetical protein
VISEYGSGSWKATQWWEWSHPKFPTPQAVQGLCFIQSSPPSLRFRWKYRNNSQEYRTLTKLVNEPTRYEPYWSTV